MNETISRAWVVIMTMTALLLLLIACDSSRDTATEPDFETEEVVRKGLQDIPEGMVLIPAGEFLMGSPEGEGEMYERPQHRVYLDAYYIDKFEVTNAQYRKFCDATGKPHPPNPSWDDNYFSEKPNHPVRNVSWKDANAYASWAEKRLPTEAEWEKAARGTDGRKYPWGNELPSTGGKYRANYDCYDSGDGTDHDIFLRDGYEYTSPVGSFENGNSPYGICDMAGNVREWCQDWYDEDYYKISPASNPKGPPSGRYHVIRGGSCFSNAANIRSAFRGSYVPGLVATSGGFRCAKDLK